MLVWPAMEKNPQKLAAWLREKIASWRPISPDTSLHPSSLLRWIRVSLRPLPSQHQRVLRGMLLFLLGIVIGIGVKSAAETRITIGHEDYRLIPPDQLYALNLLRNQALDRGVKIPLNEKKTYPACLTRFEEE